MNHTRLLAIAIFLGSFHCHAQADGKKAKKLNKNYAIGISASYPLALGVEGSVTFNDLYFIKALVGPSFEITHLHQIHAETVATQDILSGTAAIAIKYPEVTMPLKIAISRVIGLDVGYKVFKNLAFTLGFLHQRMSINGEQAVPLFADVIVNNRAVQVDLNSSIQVEPRSQIDQTDLRVGSSWEFLALKNLSFQLFGGYWYSILKSVELNSHLSFESQLNKEILGTVVNLDPIISPQIAKSEQKVDDDVLAEHLKPQVPLFVGLSFSYLF